MIFDKSPDQFPNRNHGVFLSHCFVSPVAKEAAEAQRRFLDAMVEFGCFAFERYPNVKSDLRHAAGALLAVPPCDVSFVCSVAEGFNLIANGYPFRPDDEILIVSDEYPSNVHPWRLQERRGVRVRVLPLDLTAEDPLSADRLEGALTPRTRVFALSHVQFTSGYKANLRRIGALCTERGIDLVVDAAQSLGVEELSPQDWGISAVAASGWKWLLGPVGASLLYTSQSFREKIAITMAGPDMMTQGADYLDHTFRPHADGRRFEYSTLPVEMIVGMTAAIRSVALRYTPRAIGGEIRRFHRMISERLHGDDRFRPLPLDEASRGPILSMVYKGDPQGLVKAASQRGVHCTARGEYVRVAPHFYHTDEEIERAARVLVEVAS